MGIEQKFVGLLIAGLFAVSSASAIVVSKGKEVPSQSRTDLKEPSRKRIGMHTFDIGLDSFARSISKTTTIESGKKDLLSPFQFPLFLGYSYQFSAEEKMAVDLDYTLFPKKGPDGGTEETHFLVRIPYIRKWTDSNFSWKAGVGLHQFSIKGKDGTVVLNNGSSTATFYIPDSTTTATQFLLESGIDYTFNKFKSSASLLLENPLNDKTRSFSLIIGLVYQIGSL